MTQLEQFLQDGWTVFDTDKELERWVNHALPFCRHAIAQPENRKWLRHDRTWFVGVNALDNNNNGAVSNGPGLDGPFMSLLDQYMGLDSFHWDRAQVSVCYPGYPGYSGDEPEAAFRYRSKRDAAHIDGLLRRGPERRRFLLEYHGFILGIPMVPFAKDASPFVVWQGSHHIAREVFRNALNDVAVGDWSQIDLTAIYRDLRQQIFERCDRIEIHARPGQSFLAHRLCLHGMATWKDGATCGPDGRMVCYFRPSISPPDWLNLP